MSIKPVAWRMQSVDGTVDSVELRRPDKWEIENLTITPLYSAPAPELAEALQRISNAYWDGELSGDMVRDIDKLLARITPK